MMIIPKLLNPPAKLTSSEKNSPNLSPLIKQQQADGYEEELNTLNLVVSFSLDDMKATIDFLRSMGFTTIEFRRIAGMCPEILTYKVSDVIPVFTFLLREAKVMGSDIRRVINRRPRLLVCNVEKRLRPTLYFLQSIGIAEVHKHTSLLSCSVEDKFIPRIDYLENIGFTNADALAMLRCFVIVLRTILSLNSITFTRRWEGI
ncbi:hypothetical protein MKW94_026418 [Papaver nudicaule]|uniref:Uncharacterized protein n=1 Tax=Papaver nudicaule TaxID=74823 RepID=A0AA42AT36_PAPNU|nr:hypothetical protein [Papaver nudicaule]